MSFCDVIAHFLFLLNNILLYQFISVAQSCSTLCDPWTAASQASLSIAKSQSLPKLMSIDLVMPSNHLILCCPPLLLPSIFPSIRVFSSESVLHIRWPKYWSFSFNISPSNEHSGLISWFYCIDVSNYPFTYWKACWLLPLFGNYHWSCHKHSCRGLCVYSKLSKIIG